ncbi:MAG: hypothetical protein AAFX87_15595 [Bacteroidota bacterium]
MKRVVKSIGMLMFLAIVPTLNSCNSEETSPPILQILENERPFIETLSLFYYGREINIWDESERLVGGDGTLEYRIFQEEDQQGTDFVTVTFFLTGGSESSFSLLNFKLLVDLNNRSVTEILGSTQDGRDLSDVNLILLLGNW